MSSISSSPPKNPPTMPNADKGDGKGKVPTNFADSGGSVTRRGITINLPPPRKPRRPFFTEPKERHYTGIWGLFWEVDPVACPLQLGEKIGWPKTRRPLPSLLTSLFFHCSVVFFLYFVPFAALFHRFSSSQPLNEEHRRVISFEFRKLSVPPRLPALHPPGPGGAPGQGSKAGTRPRLGAAHFDPRVTIISNPVHPDNLRFTVHNPAVPPTLKLPKDTRVADLILGSLQPLPAPPVLKPPPPKPVPPHVEAPKPALLPKPALVAPPNPLATLDLASKMSPLPMPKLEVAAGPPPPSPKNAEPIPPEGPAKPDAKPSDVPNATSPDGEKRAGGAQFTSLSVDPIPLKDMGTLPPGNAEGAFSISPTGSLGAGSPGGEPGGGLGVGKGGEGAGGDRSVGIGKGEAGGGGGPGGVAGGSLSVSGTGGGPSGGLGGGGGGGGGGTLPPLDAAALVYPVTTTSMKPRVSGFVVSSGPAGGGGLRVFNVLHGEKIYTIYLPMPGKSWILQYCAHEDSPKPAETSRTVQVHMLPPLTPPDAIGQFDFHRPPSKSEPGNDMIILHGLIHEDGSVSNLEILKGSDQLLDDAAMAAFARWKFRPALRSGTPVAVDILVGIPAIVPGG